MMKKILTKITDHDPFENAFALGLQGIMPFSESEPIARIVFHCYLVIFLINTNLRFKYQVQQ